MPLTNAMPGRIPASRFWIARDGVETKCFLFAQYLKFLFLLVNMLLQRLIKVIFCQPVEKNCRAGRGQNFKTVTLYKPLL
ncbi:hypothetical protein BRADI_2g25094v3 [Brachypodium distachyon]|uniref:Uncharacterized protein n=1 Tax=Brachypodium distachyon TaxID=15368 RepID=A0A2K2DAC5_BRADI|nr:hypothetical protein BRADI_2g25094v3 [Brachypodium distachyon]